MQKRQRFTAEFKREAVRLLKVADKPAAAIARESPTPARDSYFANREEIRQLSASAVGCDSAAYWLPAAARRITAPTPGLL